MTNNDERPEYCIYCDESCHLEFDRQPVMVLGAVWCAKSEVEAISAELQELKQRHGATAELKWGKVSRSKMPYYRDLINWYVGRAGLQYRGLVVLEKGRLDHDAFNQGDHDLFYYKMYFSLLREILDPRFQYRIYLDIKDTRSRKKVKKLKEVLCNDRFDFTSQMIAHLQNIRSHESQLMQLADFLSGAVSYKHRYILRNGEHAPTQEKAEIVTRIENALGVNLGRSTSRAAEKLNLFCFTPRERGA
jgi:hypothetical protein